MTRFVLPTIVLTLGLALAALVPAARADELRNVKRGEPMPAYKLPAIDGALIDSEALKGSVVVLVCLSAEQRSSELAAIDSRDALRALGTDPVRLVHVTADVVAKAYFEKFRQERKLDVPLAFDADRALYSKLGLIVYPTTIVVNGEGKLAHVISLHNPDYSNILDAYVRHALGKLNDRQLEDRLKSHTASNGSPKSMASTHRAAARFMREKGRFDQAREELLKARDLDPTDVEIQLDLADVNVTLGTYDEAEKLVQGVLAVRADHRRAKQVKGIIFYRRHQLVDAEKTLIEALDLNPEPSRIHYYLGRIYEEQNNTAKALEHYREALKKFLNEPEPGAKPTPARAPEPKPEKPAGGK